MRSTIETGRPIVAIVETPAKGRAKVVGWLKAVTREAGGIAHEIVVEGTAAAMDDDEGSQSK